MPARRVFEYKGRQMVVTYSGGNVIMGGKRGDDVWLFSLDGTLGPVAESRRRRRRRGPTLRPSSLLAQGDR